MNLTDEQFLDLVEAAHCVIDQCEEDQCGRFATWDTWEFGRHEKRLGYCDKHCPPCTEQRGGYCKEGIDGYPLAIAINALLDRSSESEGADRG